MQTVADNLRRWGGQVVERISDLLGPPRRLRDVNAGSSSIMIVGPHFSFGDALSLEQKRLRSQLGEDYGLFIAMVHALLAGQPKSIQRMVSQQDKTIRSLIELSHLLPYSTIDSAKAGAAEAVAKLLDAVSSLHDAAEGAIVLVPDTNALIYSPTFEAWSFDDIPEYEILLVPTLLSELDSLKVEHRNPDVRRKANEVIRQVKEYRRRGPLSGGVDIVSGRIRLRSVAVEPRVEDSLPWLDPTSQDDRMLASCLGAMRVHSRSVVMLVTGDINLQNKAEFARVPFIEPPDALAEAQRASSEEP